jgi:hypothetical protein
MADFVFNIAKGKVKYYCELPVASGAGDCLTIVLLKAAEADSTLKDYTNLLSLLAGASNEADFTNYGARKEITSVTITVDNTNDRVDIAIPDQTWANAGGATNNTLTDLLICYDPLSGSGTDSDIIPLTCHDFTPTTDGSDLTADVATAGFFRAS